MRMHACTDTHTGAGVTEWWWWVGVVLVPGSWVPVFPSSCLPAPFSLTTLTRTTLLCDCVGSGQWTKPPTSSLPFAAYALHMGSASTASDVISQFPFLPMVVPSMSC